MRHTAFCLCALLLACVPPSNLGPPEPVDLVIAATTDVHGRLRAWDYYANRPRLCAGCRGRRPSSTRCAPRIRGVSSCSMPAISCREIRSPTWRRASRQSNQPDHRRDERDALRRCGDRESRVQLWTAVPRQRGAPGDIPVSVGQHLPTQPGGSSRLQAVDDRRACRRKDWNRRCDDSRRDGVGSREHSRPARFGDIVPAVRQAVREARAAGADIVLVTVHSGLNEPSSYDTVATGVTGENVAARIAARCRASTLVLYGHSHKENRGTTIGQTLLMQPKNWATSVAVAHLVVSRANGAWR